MGLEKFLNLGELFEDVVYSRPVFPFFKKAFSLKRHFNAAVGISRFAIEPKILFPHIETALSQGKMYPMNAVALMCVNSNRHDNSLFDAPDFLKNFLDLYSAQSWQECCEIEGIQEGTADYMRIQYIAENQEKLNLTLHAIDHGSLSQKERAQRREKAIENDQKKRLEDVKSHCWARDLERATTPNAFERIVLGRKPILISDVQKVLRAYQKDVAKNLDQQDKINKEVNPDSKPNYTALDKETYLEFLREADKRGDLSETQCGIMLMFILHAREKRKKSGDSYISHPVGVSKLVGELGRRYLGNAGQVWMAQMAALLHDGGEKTDIDLEKDLVGLLPKDVIAAIKCLHKKDDETYFQYLERLADNRLASVVKLCDIYHNSTDVGNDPTAKQAFVYPLAANYIEYRLNNPDSRYTVEEFVRRSKICSIEDLDQINKIAESGENVAGKDAEKAAKKQPASDFPDLQKALSKVKSIQEILLKETPENAYPRREENLTLQA